MADKNVELAIKVTADASDVDQTFDRAGQAALDLADDVETAARKADTAAGRFDGVGDSADNMASKSSQATGALGALSAGFELVGAEKYAGSLQSAAMATDFLSGVGDSLNLVMESQALATARAKVASIGHTIATKAQAVATKTMTIAQKALNLAMRANPIGLIITAVTLLVGGFILLYKRSERFRSIVQAVGRAGQQALGWIIDKATAVGDWFGDKIPAAASKMKDLVVGYIKLVTAPWRLLIDVIKNVIQWVRDKIPPAFNAMKSGVVSAVNAVLSPFQKIYDLIVSIIDKIKDIKLPSLGDVGDFLNPLNRTAIPGKQYGNPSTSSAGTTVNNTININGVIDPYSAAISVQDVLLRHGRALGYEPA